MKSVIEVKSEQTATENSECKYFDVSLVLNKQIFPRSPLEIYKDLLFNSDFE